jgi:hypothetical protein
MCDEYGNPTFRFTATVTASGESTIQVGDLIQGTVTDEPARAGSADHYTFAGSAKAHTLSSTDDRKGAVITSDRYAGRSTSPCQIITTIASVVS